MESPDIAIDPRCSDILKAAYYGRWADVDIAIASGDDINVSVPESHSRKAGHSALMLCLDKRHAPLKTVKALLAAGADLEARTVNGSTPLIVGCFCEARIGSLKALIAAGADVDAVRPDGQTALHACVVHGFTKGLQLLLKAGARTDFRLHKSGETAADQARRIANAAPQRHPDQPERVATARAVSAILDSFAVSKRTALLESGTQEQLSRAPARRVKLGL